ncbi:MAG TPA: hypothetical protein VMJ66_15235 [Geobacteraceae bacterium]|nr:hypothetical protein [Geobacteraceae bacterium]
MPLKTRIWMTGSLDWFALIGGEEVFLGRRQVPYPLEEGDSWTNGIGDIFRVENGEVRIVERCAPQQEY